jgi:hypothetical protein
MATVKEVRVDCSFLKNLPNYQNVRVTAGATLELQKGDNVQDVYEKAWDMIGQEVQSQLKLFEDNKV